MFKTVQFKENSYGDDTKLKIDTLQLRLDNFLKTNALHCRHSKVDGITCTELRTMKLIGEIKKIDKEIKRLNNIILELYSN